MWIALSIFGFLALIIAIILLLPVKVIIKNDGNVIPSIAIIAPITPEILYPIKVEQFNANGPGKL